MRQAFIGLIALALAGGAVAVTGINLVRGGLTTQAVPAYADFSNCGQGLRELGDVKLRGVLVGRIGAIERAPGRCRVTLDLRPNAIEEIPQNVGAQIRAKTIFGEKWVELLFPKDPVEDRIAAGDRIDPDKTIEPLEVETILNLALPLLQAIDPENLSAALTALAEGFAGQEEAAIRGIESGLEALAPINENPRLFGESLDQLQGTAELFERIDEDLIASLRNLDRLNRFTSSRQDLLAENLSRVPELLRELSLLFETRFQDLTMIVNRGATVISVLAARSDDLDRLLTVLPRFNSNWIRNLNHVCEFRQTTDEAGKSQGDRVPGRCWRVHNLMSSSQGGYHGDGPEDKRQASASKGAAAEGSPADLVTLLLRALPELELASQEAAR